MYKVWYCGYINRKGDIVMEKYVYKNGYIEIWVDGVWVGNYDTVEEYHAELVFRKNRCNDERYN